MAIHSSQTSRSTKNPAFKDLYYSQHPGMYFYMNESGDIAPMQKPSLICFDAMVFNHVRNFLIKQIQSTVNPKIARPIPNPKLESLFELIGTSAVFDFRSALIESSSRWINRKFAIDPDVLKTNLHIAKLISGDKNIEPDSSEVLLMYQNDLSRILSEIRVVRAALMKLSLLIQNRNVAHANPYTKLKCFLDWMRDDLKINSSFAVGIAIHGLFGEDKVIGTVNKFLKLTPSCDIVETALNASWDVYHTIYFKKLCQDQQLQPVSKFENRVVERSQLATNKLFVTEDVDFIHLMSISSYTEFAIQGETSSEMVRLLLPKFKNPDVTKLIEQYIDDVSIRANSRTGLLSTSHLDALIESLRDQIQSLPVNEQPKKHRP